ncbi:beta-glucosidase BglX [Marinoscillum furvescens]|uniref:Periplasmic beta-glucosidase n=1 Tax=Marinoscillum furvescens DSM 4134 TaxID=1122208 RepID=A0A3D9L326_MARFU|nr:beta-glucosidase BglX [Marinoscillum furvescens]RED96182.1 beta-glucosidase [Marinoscillum furvescens DSM 4134]
MRGKQMKLEMKELMKISWLLVMICMVGCGRTERPQSPSDVGARVDSLMQLMTLEEKIGQLNLPSAGDISTGEATSSGIGQKIKEGKVGGLFNIKTAEKIREVQRIAVEESRLKIPLIFAMDVIHGYKTVFPIPLGLAASWNMQNIERSARIAANEATADGIAWTFSPMVDIARDPRWGRVAEGAGEDPFLGGEIAKAMVRGYQGDDLTAPNTMLACVKHFALYGASEAGRDYNTTDMSRLRMYNEYFYPYQAAVDAGVGSVMASFNEIDGIPATGNRWLMTEVLRNQWDFNGFVVSDYTGINEMIAHGMGDLEQVSALALKAGIDMDMVGEGFLTTLQKSLEEGKITEAAIDQACRRILEAKFRLGLFENPYQYADPERAKKEVFTAENRAEARKIAAESFVLLKNENNVLPIQSDQTIALVGPLADNKENMAGTWSVAADFDQAVSLKEGIEQVMPDARILHARGSNIYADKELEARVSIFGKPTYRDERSEAAMIREAVAVAKKADVVVAALGEAAEMSGESSSRTDIGLPKTQQKLLNALLKTGKPVVLVLFTGRPLAIKWEAEHVPAILNVWFGGTEAGLAIADVLSGEVNPSGKLPMTFPQNVGQVPIFYNHKNTGRPLPEGKWFQKFRSNYLDVSNEPLYAFGYGLSYTTFEYGEISVSHTAPGASDVVKLTVPVTNTGKVSGKEVVQLYIRDLVGSTTRPVKELKGFQKVAINAGETKEVTFEITTDDLKFYTYDQFAKDQKIIHTWEPGVFELMVGGSSDAVQKVEITWSK